MTVRRVIMMSCTLARGIPLRGDARATYILYSVADYNMTITVSDRVQHVHYYYLGMYVYACEKKSILQSSARTV